MIRGTKSAMFCFFYSRSMFLYGVVSGEEFQLHFQQTQSSFSHAYSAQPEMQMQLL